MLDWQSYKESKVRHIWTEGAVEQNVLPVGKNKAITSPILELVKHLRLDISMSIWWGRLMQVGNPTRSPSKNPHSFLPQESLLWLHVPLKAFQVEATIGDIHMYTLLYTRVGQ